MEPVMFVASQSGHPTDPSLRFARFPPVHSAYGFWDRASSKSKMISEKVMLRDYLWLMTWSPDSKRILAKIAPLGMSVAEANDKAKAFEMRGSSTTEAGSTGMVFNTLSSETLHDTSLGLIYQLDAA
jgi:hypothetical protein